MVLYIILFLLGIVSIVLGILGFTGIFNVEKEEIWISYINVILGVIVILIYGSFIIEEIRFRRRANKNSMK